MTRSQHWKGQVRAIGWLLFALLLLVGPFNRAGLWEPYELRFAELSRHLSHQLFGTNGALYPSEPGFLVSLQRLGQGELPYTSAALGFKLLGLHDYAGRLPSLFWGFVAATSLWFLLGRIESKAARVFGVLALVSLPSFVLQSRMMLGDAATMGALSLSTTGLAIACLFDGTVLARSGWLLLGLLGLVAGQLSRGILVGVAVPLLAVGSAGLALAHRANEDVSKRWRAAGLPGSFVVAGLLAAGLGGFVLWQSPHGPSALLAANLSGPMEGGTFAQCVTTVLHSAFPWSAFLPAAIAIVASPSKATDSASCREDALATALLLVALLTIGSMGALGARNVEFTFPAVTALAGICALALSRGARDGRSAKLVAASVATLAVLVYADFENTTEKLMLVSGHPVSAIPAGFLAENRWWLRGVLGVVLLACVAVGIGARSTVSRPFSRARLEELVMQVRQVLAGHFLSGLTLLETTLVTTALLVHAHESEWIQVPFFAATLPTFGALLRFAWLVPPLVVVVVPGLYVLGQEVVTWLLTPPATVGARRGFSGRVAPLVILGTALIAGGLLLTLGHGPRLYGQLSAKSTLLRYRDLATQGEELALLGVGAQASRYYLGTTPKSFTDVERAAQWLSLGQGKRRFIAFEMDTLSELNAAFRSHAGRANLVLPDREQGRVLLALHPMGSSSTNHNPLLATLPTVAPQVSRQLEGTFGGVIEAIGWDLLDRSGRVVMQASAGGEFRLRLVFRVVATPRADLQIFVHLDGQGRRQIADHDPAGGHYSTVLWQTGDVIVDELPIHFDTAWRPGSCRMYVGFFRKTTRLDVTEGMHQDNRLDAGDIVIR